MAGLRARLTLRTPAARCPRRSMVPRSTRWSWPAPSRSPTSAEWDSPACSPCATVLAPWKPNSAYRVAGLADRWDWAAISDLELGDGPILLVTDCVDTGWSVTLAAAALASATGREVLPLALASRG